MSERGKRRFALNRKKPLRSSKPELLGYSIVLFLVKLVLRGRASVYWQTEGHNWALCPKGTDIKPGFETIFQQQAAYTPQKFTWLIQSYSSTQKLSKATKKEKKERRPPPPVDPPVEWWNDNYVESYQQIMKWIFKTICCKLIFYGVWAKYFFSI